MYLIKRSCYGTSWEVIGYVENEKSAIDYCKKHEDEHLKFCWEKVKKLGD